MGEGEACTGFWWGTLRETARRKWEDNMKMDIQEVGLWTGLSWLRIETGGGHL
jgi:hypothetical protein